MFVRVAKNFSKSEIHRFEYTCEHNVNLQEEEALKFTKEFGECVQLINKMEYVRRNDTKVANIVRP